MEHRVKRLVTVSCIKTPKANTKLSLVQTLFSSYTGLMNGINTKAKERPATQESFYAKNWRFNRAIPSRNNKLFISQSKATKAIPTHTQLAPNFSELENILNRSRALKIAGDCSKEVATELVTQAFPEQNNKVKSEWFNESYKSGTKFFIQLLRTKERVINEFLGKVRARKSFLKDLYNSTHPLKRVVEDMRTLELLHSFSKNTSKPKSQLSKRQRRFKYSKWYLNPKDFNKYYND